MNNYDLAIKFKLEGNALFHEKKYNQAIQKYSQGISSCTNISILYSNRARCRLLIGQLEEVLVDTQQAVKIDDKNIKAYFIMGEALVQIASATKDASKIQIAIEKLKKSLVLCPSQSKNEFQEKFIDKIYQAKKKLWQITVQNEKNRKKQLRSFLINLIESDNNLSQNQKDLMDQRIENLLDSHIKIQKTTIPRSLVCHIEKKLMKNPICNEYGNSFSKKAYFNEINKNGKLDPITKQPIKTNINYPNINLQKAIIAFLQKNPWAYDEITQL